MEQPLEGLSTKLIHSKMHHEPCLQLQRDCADPVPPEVHGCCHAGEVPNLFPKDELAGVLDEVRAAAKKAGAGETGEAVYAYFLERVRTNLHVILCLSPIGEAFRERCRMFPGVCIPHTLPSNSLQTSVLSPGARVVLSQWRGAMLCQKLLSP